MSDRRIPRCTECGREVPGWRNPKDSPLCETCFNELADRNEIFITQASIDEYLRKHPKKRPD